MEHGVLAGKTSINVAFTRVWRRSVRVTWSLLCGSSVETATTRDSIPVREC